MIDFKVGKTHSQLLPFELLNYSDHSNKRGQLVLKFYVRLLSFVGRMIGLKVNFNGLHITRLLNLLYGLII